MGIADEPPGALSPAEAAALELWRHAPLRAARRLAALEAALRLLDPSSPAFSLEGGASQLPPVSQLTPADALASQLLPLTIAGGAVPPQGESAYGVPAPATYPRGPAFEDDVQISPVLTEQLAPEPISVVDDVMLVAVVGQAKAKAKADDGDDPPVVVSAKASDAEDVPVVLSAKPSDAEDALVVVSTKESPVMVLPSEAKKVPTASDVAVVSVSVAGAKNECKPEAGPDPVHAVGVVANGLVRSSASDHGPAAPEVEPVLLAPDSVATVFAAKGGEENTTVDLTAPQPARGSPKSPPSRVHALRRRRRRPSTGEYSSGGGVRRRVSVSDANSSDDADDEMLMQSPLRRKSPRNEVGQVRARDQAGFSSSEDEQARVKRRRRTSRTLRRRPTTPKQDGSDVVQLATETDKSAAEKESESVLVTSAGGQGSGAGAVAAVNPLAALMASLPPAQRGPPAASSQTAGKRRYRAPVRGGALHAHLLGQRPGYGSVVGKKSPASQVQAKAPGTMSSSMQSAAPDVADAKLGLFDAEVEAAPQVVHVPDSPAVTVEPLVPSGVGSQTRARGGSSNRGRSRGGSTSRGRGRGGSAARGRGRGGSSTRGTVRSSRMTAAPPAIVSSDDDVPQPVTAKSAAPSKSPRRSSGRSKRRSLPAMVSSDEEDAPVPNAVEISSESSEDQVRRPLRQRAPPKPKPQRRKKTRARSSSDDSLSNFIVPSDEELDGDSSSDNSDEVVVRRKPRRRRNERSRHRRISNSSDDDEPVPRVHPPEYMFASPMRGVGRQRGGADAIKSNLEAFQVYLEAVVVTSVDEKVRDILVSGRGCADPELTAQVSRYRTAITRIEQDVCKARAMQHVSDGRWQMLLPGLNERPFLTVFENMLYIMPQPSNPQGKPVWYCNGCNHRPRTARYHEPTNTVVLHGPRISESSYHKQWPKSATVAPNGSIRFPNDLVRAELSGLALERRFRRRRMRQWHEYHLDVEDLPIEEKLRADEEGIPLEAWGGHHGLHKEACASSSSSSSQSNSDDSDDSDPEGFGMAEECMGKCALYHELVWVRWRIAKLVRAAIEEALMGETCIELGSDMAARLSDELIHGDGGQPGRILKKVRREVNGLLRSAQDYGIRKGTVIVPNNRYNSGYVDGV